MVQSNDRTWWTDEMRERAYRMKEEQRLSCAQVGRLMGVTASAAKAAILYYKKKNGIPVLPNSMSGRTWSDQDRKLAFDLSKRMTYKDVGKQLGVTGNSVSGAIHKWRRDNDIREPSTDPEVRQKFLELPKLRCLQ